MATHISENRPRGLFRSGTEVASARRWAWILYLFIASFAFTFWPTTAFPPFEMRFVSLLLFATATLVFFRPRHLRNRFALLLLGFLVLVVASLLVARDSWMIALLGNEARYDGLFHQLALIAIALFALALFRLDRKIMRSALGLFLVVMGVQAALIVGQRLRFDPLGQLVAGYDVFQAPVGTIGNTGFAAGLLLAALLLGVGFLKAANGRPRQVALLALIALLALALGFTDNKASVYGLLAVLAAAVVLDFRPRTLLAAVLVVVTIFGGRAVIPDPTSTGSDYDPRRSAAGRQVIWGIAVEAIRNTPYQPLLGGGPDALELAQYREQVDPLSLIPFYLRNRWLQYFEDGESLQILGVEPRYQEGQDTRGKAFVYQLRRGNGELLLINQQPVVDKAHNFLLDLTLSYGVLSAVIWSLLYLWPVYRGFRSRDPLLQGLAWSFAALFIYFLAWFPANSNEPYFVILLAAGWALLLPRPSDAGATQQLADRREATAGGGGSDPAAS